MQRLGVKVDNGCRDVTVKNPANALQLTMLCPDECGGFGAVEAGPVVATVVGASSPSLSGGILLAEQAVEPAARGPNGVTTCPPGTRLGNQGRNCKRDCIPAGAAWR